MGWEDLVEYCIKKNGLFEDFQTENFLHFIFKFNERSHQATVPFEARVGRFKKVINRVFGRHDL